MPEEIAALDDLELLDLGDLDKAIADAQAVVQAPRRFERLRAAAARRDQRAHAEAAERAALIATLSQQRDDYRASFLAQLRELEATPPTQAGALVEAAITAARQWFALGSSLAGALGARFAARWDGSDLIESAGPRAWRAYWTRIGARPVPLTREQQPWLADLARLRELMATLPPQPGRIGNGG